MITHEYVIIAEPPTPTSPRLQRQATICLRGHLSKQTSLEEGPARVVFENEDGDTANGAGMLINVTGRIHSCTGFIN